MKSTQSFLDAFRRASSVVFQRVPVRSLEQPIEVRALLCGGRREEDHPGPELGIAPDETKHHVGAAAEIELAPALWQRMRPDRDSRMPQEGTVTTPSSGVP